MLSFPDCCNTRAHSSLRAAHQETGNVRHKNLRFRVAPFSLTCHHWPWLMIHLPSFLPCGRNPHWIFQRPSMLWACLTSIDLAFHVSPSFAPAHLAPWSGTNAGVRCRSSLSVFQVGSWTPLQRQGTLKCPSLAALVCVFYFLTLST